MKTSLTLSKQSVRFAAPLVGLLASLIVGAAAQAQVSSDLESLGSNRDVVRRAESLESRSRVAIVQDRIVKRDWRLELGANMAPVAFGDSYLDTRNFGLQVDLHVTPKFSLGVRYAKAFNELTPTGRKAYDDYETAVSEGSLDARQPDIDYPEQSILGVVNWYMMYGKMNFFDLRVVQFDLYSLAGAGQVTLSKGPSTLLTAGGGVGFWLSQHITSRFEILYQTYNDRPYTGERKLDLIVANFGIGVLL